MPDPETIYNWRRLDDRLTTSGQPTEAQLADIRALGVRHVVNLGLHTHEKALPDEGASVAGLGMTYTHIPVDFQKPTDQDFEQFCAVMQRLNAAPVHVHCIANYRVSAFVYRYRRDVLGMAEPRARADLEAIWHPDGVWAEFVDATP
ncbi:MAG: protein tyrosine phosphatase family protein [Chloroflexi bacterium]|nr:protein tyrosine phosphatase family protein [Chloroflexota bacterium]